MRPERWITLALAAQWMGLPIRRARRRLLALDQLAGGRLIRHLGDGRGCRYWVDRRGLVEILRGDDLDALDSELRHHERLIQQLRRRVRALERLVGDAAGCLERPPGASDQIEAPEV